MEVDISIVVAAAAAAAAKFCAKIIYASVSFLSATAIRWKFEGENRPMMLFLSCMIDDPTAKDSFKMVVPLFSKASKQVNERASDY